MRSLTLHAANSTNNLVDRKDLLSSEGMVDSEYHQLDSAGSAMSKTNYHLFYSF